MSKTRSITLENLWKNCSIGLKNSKFFEIFLLFNFADLLTFSFNLTNPGERGVAPQSGFPTVPLWGRGGVLQISAIIHTLVYVHTHKYNTGDVNYSSIQESVQTEMN